MGTEYSTLERICVCKKLTSAGQISQNMHVTRSSILNMVAPRPPTAPKWWHLDYANVAGLTSFFQQLVAWLSLVLWLYLDGCSQGNSCQAQKGGSRGCYHPCCFTGQILLSAFFPPIPHTFCLLPHPENSTIHTTGAPAGCHHGIEKQHIVALVQCWCYIHPMPFYGMLVIYRIDTMGNRYQDWGLGFKANFKYLRMNYPKILSAITFKMCMGVQ